VGQIACSTEDQDKIKQLVYYEATSESSSAVNDLAMQNVDLAINILKSSNLPLTQEIQTLQPEDIFVGGFNSAALLIFLEALKSISDMITFGSKPHLVP
jgi:spermidine/putrescine-binding protein